MFSKRGELFIISAPSGAGKTTLCNMLLEEFDTLSYSVSYTTRKPREGEKNGVHYHFVDTNTFEYMISTGDFIEHAKVHGNLYGTSRKYLEAELKTGRDILMDIDLQGAMQLKEKISYGVFVFILPPSIDVLRNRLMSRQDTAESMELRLMNAVEEIAAMPDYDYVVINDDLNTAYKDLSSVYIAERCNTRRIIDFTEYIGRNF